MPFLFSTTIPPFLLLLLQLNVLDRNEDISEYYNNITASSSVKYFHVHKFSRNKIKLSIFNVAVWCFVLGIYVKFSISEGEVRIGTSKKLFGGYEGKIEYKLIGNSKRG